MSEAAPPPGRGRGSRWPERLLLVLGVVLLLAGALSIPLRHQLTPPVHRGITGEVLEELEPAGHIEAEPGALAGWNVLVVTTDTTRSDHLHAYGNRSVDTPVLDGLARDGVLFADAVTPSPSTLPAHTSLLTGLYPVHHGVRANGSFRVEDRVVTLAERLRGAGYRTGAVISAFVLDSRFGLDQGFEHYHDDLTKGIKLGAHMFRERPAELTNEPAVAWLRENREGPFFLWVHYFDPHAAYLPPEPFRADYRADPYDGEIAYVDSQIGALLAEIEALGQRERTLVVYASDHGEGLGEHGEQTHSLLAYDATLRIPLLFHAPAGLPRGRVVTRQSSLVDVVPTVLGLLGQPVPEDLDGRDLTRELGPEPRSVYFETLAPMTLHGWAPLLGIRREDYKYIWAPTPELYDLRSDPREERNLHEEEPEIAAGLHAELVALLGDDPLTAVRLDEPLELDDETRQHLAALGYLQTVESAAAPVDFQQFDPKQMVHHWEKVQNGINLRSQGRIQEALPILEEAVASVERDLFARSVLASALLMRGDYDRAYELYLGSHEFEPKDENSLLGLASVHLARQELDQAEARIAQAEAVAPESAGPLMARARLALARRQPAEARRLLERAIELDPGSSGPAAWTQIGWMELRTGRTEAAREAFRSALRIDALNGAARDGLANLLFEEEKLDEAAQMLAEALRFDPNQPRALATLAALISRTGDHERAREVVERALALTPKLPEAHNAIGVIHRRRGELELAEEHYRKAIEYGPELAEPHINLAQLQLRRGDREAAMQEFEAALEANPFNKIALANLGVRHYEEGRPGRARRFYLRALAVDPNYALVHRNLGALYLEREQPVRAAHHLRRSLEIEPRQPGAEEMRHRLSEAERALAEAPGAGTAAREGS